MLGVYLNMFYLLPLLIICLAPLLPVQTHFHYDGRGDCHALLIRFGLFHERLGFSTKLVLGKSEQQPFFGWQLRVQTRLKLLMRPRQVNHYRIPLPFGDWSQFSRSWGQFGNASQQLLHKSACQHLTWETTIGFTDYATTGVVIGLCWAGKELAVSFLGRLLDLHTAEVRINVIPSFGRPVYESNLDCIFQTRFGHIMVELIRIVFWRLRKSK